MDYPPGRKSDCCREVAISGGSTICLNPAYFWPLEYSPNLEQDQGILIYDSVPK